MKIGSTEASVTTRVEQNIGALRNKQAAATEEVRMRQPGEREQAISERVVIETIERANKAINVTYRRFEFSIHEKTKEIMVKIIDTETDEVIREIPPEKILDMVAMMWEMVGIIVDERR